MKQNLSYLVGIDIGSTTVKVVVLDENKQIQYKRYERHHSKVREKTLEILRETQGILKDKTFHVAISGSAGLGVSQSAKIPFVQEVFATKIACDRLLRDIDVVVGKNEWYLCRRYRCLHRSDGFPAGHVSRGA